MLPTVLGMDIEARPDGPSPLNDEPDLAGRHGVDREFDGPVGKPAVEPLQ